MTVTETGIAPAQITSETLPANAVLVLAQEELPTSDNRIMAAGSVAWRDPMPLKPEHYCDEVAGVISPVGRVASLAGLTVENLAEKIGTAGAYIVGLVTFDLGYDSQGNLLDPDAEGRDVARQAEGGFLTGASVELGSNAEFEYECMELDPEDPEWCLAYAERLVSGTVIACAMTPTQALETAGIIDVGDPPASPPDVAAVAASALERSRWWATPDPTARPVVASAVASMPAQLPRDAFFMPEPDGYMDFTVDGWRCYGHIAPPDVCHVAIKDYCQLCPTSDTGYDAFHQLPVRTDDGILKVGLLCTDTLHIDLQHDDGTWVTGEEARQIAFENPGARAAYLRATDGAHGLWVCGVLHPQVSPEQISRIETTPVSGEWRSIELADGTVIPQELITVNCVNVPGYPNVGPRARVLTASINGNPEPAIVAMSAALGRGRGCDCEQHRHPVAASAAPQEGDRLARIEAALTAAGLLEALDAGELDALAARIGA
jgi:hypothetical protein